MKLVVRRRMACAILRNIFEVGIREASGAVANEKLVVFICED